MGLLNPGALIFTLLFAVLLLLYLRERQRRRVEVPSLLLWQTVRADAVRAQKFRPDILFLLQLLLLAGLILGLARPYVVGRQARDGMRRHIFVLDVSASMQAQEALTTRFQAAREELRRRLAGLPDGDEVMLMTAAARPEVLVDFTRDRAAVGRALDTLTATDTGTDLEPALAVAAAARRRAETVTEVTLFSDVPPSQVPARWRDEAAIVQFGETDDNLAITGLHVFQSRFQDPRDAQAYTVVQNFAHREGHGVLTIRREDTVMSRSGFTVPARDTRAFLASGFTGPGRVSAKLDDDALAADNAALAWIRPLVATRVVLVSRAGPLVDELKRIARVTPGLQLSVASADDYDRRAPADVFIFHRIVPKDEPERPALYLYPEPGNSVLPVTGEVRDVEVLDWNDRHPAVGSLRPLSALPIRRARVVLPTAWQQPLLISRTLEREFSLAFAGTLNGQRVACITFDIERERLLGSDNLNFLLFFLNLLSWLAPDPHEVLTVATGAVVALDGLPTLPATVTDPRGQRVELPNGENATLEPLIAGEYRIGADGVTRTVYANLFDPIESDIGRASREPVVPAVAQVRTPTAVTQDAGGAEFGWWLFAGAAGLFVIEWMVSVRGR